MEDTEGFRLDLPIPLTRPLAVVDLETTGLDPARDRVVEIAVLVLLPDGSSDQKVRRINPGMPIPPAATAVHGIGDADVADEPGFAALARSLAALLEPCDLAGFNIRRFDLPMLLAEFRRSGIDFDVSERCLIDVQTIFHREEPRDLSAAARFYLGQEPENAHTALGDIQVTARVLAAQLDRYTELPRDIGGLQTYCDEVRPFQTEADRWFRRGADGDFTFRRGKHRGKSLKEVARTEMDYLQWMIGAEDMDPEVLRIVRDALSN
jgi:DNA polymerase III subunit epsilon